MKSLFKKMKQNFGSKLLVLGTLSLASTSHAGLINTTVRGGLGIYAPSMSGFTTSAGKGIIGGVGIEAGLGPISVIADVMYAKRSISIPAFNSSSTLTYIHVPVQGQLSLGLFHVSGGFYYAQAMGDVAVVLNGTASNQTYADANTSKTDFGGVAGIGVGIPLGITTVSADLRYNLGMKNISTDTAVVTKNRSIDLVFGLTF